MLCVPILWKIKHGLKPAQAQCSVQISFVSSSVFIHWAGRLWQTFVHFKMNSRRNISSTQLWCSQLIHSTDTAVYLKQRPPSSPACVDINSALFAAAVVRHTLHYSLSFMSASSLPISSWALFCCICVMVTMVFCVEILSQEKSELIDLFDQSLMLWCIVFQYFGLWKPRTFRGIPSPSGPLQADSFPEGFAPPSHFPKAWTVHSQHVRLSSRCSCSCGTVITTTVLQGKQEIQGCAPSGLFGHREQCKKAYQTFWFCFVFSIENELVRKMNVASVTVPVLRSWAYRRANNYWFT